jgi:hypothetical protein
VGPNHVGHDDAGRAVDGQDLAVGPVLLVDQTSAVEDHEAVHRSWGQE